MIKAKKGIYDEAVETRIYIKGLTTLCTRIKVIVLQIHLFAHQLDKNNTLRHVDVSYRHSKGANKICRTTGHIADHSSTIMLYLT